MDDRAGGQVSGCGGLGREIKRDFGSGGITCGMRENTPVSGSDCSFSNSNRPGFTKMQPGFHILAIIPDGIARPGMSTFCLRKREWDGYKVVVGLMGKREGVLNPAGIP